MVIRASVSATLVLMILACGGAGSDPQPEGVFARETDGTLIELPTVAQLTITEAEGFPAETYDRAEGVAPPQLTSKARLEIHLGEGRDVYVRAALLLPPGPHPEDVPVSLQGEGNDSQIQRIVLEGGLMPGALMILVVNCPTPEEVICRAHLAFIGDEVPETTAGSVQAAIVNPLGPVRLWMTGQAGEMFVQHRVEQVREELRAVATALEAYYVESQSQRDPQQVPGAGPTP